jgi:hypothetical protein
MLVGSSDSEPSEERQKMELYFKIFVFTYWCNINKSHKKPGSADS